MAAKYPRLRQLYRVLRPENGFWSTAYDLCRAALSPKYRQYLVLRQKEIAEAEDAIIKGIRRAGARTFSGQQLIDEFCTAFVKTGLEPARAALGRLLRHGYLRRVGDPRVPTGLFERTDKPHRSRVQIFLAWVDQMGLYKRVVESEKRLSDTINPKDYEV
jgi:hypothetical protein